jgi:hypothetical protein
VGIGYVLSRISGGYHDAARGLARGGPCSAWTSGSPWTSGHGCAW